MCAQTQTYFIDFFSYKDNFATIIQEKSFVIIHIFVNTFVTDGLLKAPGSHLTVDLVKIILQVFLYYTI